MILDVIKRTYAELALLPRVSALTRKGVPSPEGRGQG